LFRGYVFRRNRDPEAGPAGAGVELGIREEQRRVAADAAVETVIVVLPEAAGAGQFGVGAARDVERLLTELSEPLFVCLHYFLHVCPAQVLAGIGELHNVYPFGIPVDCLCQHVGPPALPLCPWNIVVLV